MNAHFLKKRVLVVTQSFAISLGLPDLFFRAGFEVDFISRERLFKYEKKIRKFFLVHTLEDLIKKTILSIESENYDLVVLGDDGTISAIKHCDLDIDKKIKLLPIVDAKHMKHLASKIGLSEVFYEAKISSPEFRVIFNSDQFSAVAEELGYPLIVKGDFSGGGAQTFECFDDSQKNEILKNFQYYPAVVQRFIFGDLVSIDAFYQNSQLVHFSYAKVGKTINDDKFSPSWLRIYTQTAFVDKSIFSDLQKIGAALGADGFCNISAIYSKELDRHYYFEADMRPTAWVDYSKYFGDCIANQIALFFNDGVVQRPEGSNCPSHFRQVVLPYFFRMSFWNIVTNKYNVLKYIPPDYIVLRAYLRKFKHYALSIVNLRALRRFLELG